MFATDAGSQDTWGGDLQLRHLQLRHQRPDTWLVQSGTLWQQLVPPGSNTGATVSPTAVSRSISSTRLRVTRSNNCNGTAPQLREDNKYVSLMIDSGAATHVCLPTVVCNTVPTQQLEHGTGPHLRTVTNQLIKLFRHRWVACQHIAGNKLSHLSMFVKLNGQFLHLQGWWNKVSNLHWVTMPDYSATKDLTAQWRTETACSSYKQKSQHYQKEQGYGHTAHSKDRLAGCTDCNLHHKALRTQGTQETTSQGAQAIQEDALHTAGTQCPVPTEQLEDYRRTTIKFKHCFGDECQTMGAPNRQQQQMWKGEAAFRIKKGTTLPQTLQQQLTTKTQPQTAPHAVTPRKQHHQEYGSQQHHTPPEVQLDKGFLVLQQGTPQLNNHYALGSSTQLNNFQDPSQGATRGSGLARIQAQANPSQGSTTRLSEQGQSEVRHFLNIQPATTGPSHRSMNMEDTSISTATPALTTPITMSRRSRAQHKRVNSKAEKQLSQHHLWLHHRHIRRDQHC